VLLAPYHLGIRHPELPPGRLQLRSLSEEDLFEVGVVPRGGEAFVLYADDPVRLQGILLGTQALLGVGERFVALFTLAQLFRSQRCTDSAQRVVLQALRRFT